MEAIRILHLEDSPLDSELIQDRLKTAGLMCEITRADGERNFEEALFGGSYDVVLTDYNLPGYDGLTAIKASRVAQPTTPVIVISGALGEDAAVLCLRSGATDYLLKDRLDRLPSAIQHALEQANGERHRRQLEAQLMRAQRIESIGTFAGSIAHDLNNALTPVVLTLELLRVRCLGNEELIDAIETGTKRAAEMLAQLLVFSKGSYVEPKPVDQRALLAETLRTIELTFPKRITVRRSISEELRHVSGDHTQLHQVLMNLCVNARDSMPAGGMLTVTAENIEIDESCAKAMPDAKPGSYVMWRVSDTGVGMTQQTLDRVFEPFFTTKGYGKGTGLGLSIVIGIVKSHGGFVNAYSVPSEGSTFSVYLPADSVGAEEGAFSVAPSPLLDGGGETILVVDDSEGVREAARALLTIRNFQVETAADGEEALDLISELPRKIRAVITDIHMPRITGDKFVVELLKVLPDVEIIVTSGNLEEEKVLNLKALGVQAFLQKPFTEEMLTDALTGKFRC